MDPPLRKPRLLFETASRPSHVTFDDGRMMRRNFPWHHYVEARWTYGEPDVIQVVIGDCHIVLAGHNLGPLFAALEEHALLRVRVEPESKDRERDGDSYVTRIVFQRAPRPAGKPGSGQTELGFDKLE